jgi:hypothetical protein
VYLDQIRGFPAHGGPIVHYLDLQLSRCLIDDCHNWLSLSGLLAQMSRYRVQLIDG